MSVLEVKLAYSNFK